MRSLDCEYPGLRILCLDLYSSKKHINVKNQIIIDSLPLL